MINKVILIGRLGRHPELKYTQAGLAISSMSLALSERWKDAQGNQQERTEWAKVSVFGKSAEWTKDWVKGQLVYVEGKLQTREWVGKEGAKKTSTDIIADTVRNLSPRERASVEVAEATHTQDESPAYFTDEDIPF